MANKIQIFPSLLHIFQKNWKLKLFEQRSMPVGALKIFHWHEQSRYSLRYFAFKGIVVAAQSLFFEVCLSLYLEDKFSMDAIEIGLMFLLFNVPNSLMVVLYGLAVDR